MSTAPTEPTYGTPLRAIAPSRSGPAENTPPTRWSAISVVVMSRTAVIRPESTSFSIDCPPVPVAWNTSGSNRASSALARRETSGVVTPNIVSPTSGRSSFTSATPAATAVTDHPGECVGGVAEHLTRDPVEAGDVGDRVHHRDVGRTDVHADVTRRDRRHHHLRHADREGAHRRRDERRTARSAGADDPAEIGRACATNRVSASDIAATDDPRSPVNTAAAPAG